jgi:branched-chain amino acid transport system permease protein
MSIQTNYASRLSVLFRDHPLQSALILAAGIFLLIFPLVFGLPFPQHVLITVFLYVVLAQSWNLLGGYAGQVSVGHAVYFGIGAYGSVLLQLNLGWSPWPAFFIGSLAAIPLSFIIGIPTFKLGGHYFVIATIAVGEVLRILFQNWDFVGGNVGLSLPMVEEGLASFQFYSSKMGYYYIALIMAIASIFIIYNIEKSKWGYYFRAIRGNQDAASALGVNPVRYKLLANMVSALIAGFAGAFYAQYVMFIDPVSVMHSQISVMVMLLTVLGGAGTLWGPVIGAAILMPISELSRVYWGGSGQGFDQVVYGLLIVLFAIFQPAGLLGLFSRIKGRKKEGTK